MYVCMYVCMYVYISKNFIVEKTWNSCHFACDDRDFEERHKLNALGQRLLGVALQAAALAALATLGVGNGWKWVRLWP